MCQWSSLLMVVWVGWEIVVSFSDRPKAKQQPKVVLRGRLHLRFGCAVSMCSEPSAPLTFSFVVQQKMLPVGSGRRSAACVFDVCFQCAISKCIITAHQERTVCCIQCNGPHISLHIENALLCSRRFAAHQNCTSKLQAASLTSLSLIYFVPSQGPAILRASASPLVPGKWYSVSVDRRLREAALTLDGEEVAKGTSPGSTRGLNIRKDVYFGGINSECHITAGRDKNVR